MIYHQLGNKFIIHAEGKTYFIPKDDERFAKLQELAAQGRNEEIGMILDSRGAYFKVVGLLLESIGQEQEE